VLACAHGRLQPLLACYYPPALERLAPAASEAQARLVETVEALDPRRYDVGDVDVLFNVNTPDDLLTAAAMLDSRQTASRT